jgi:hypothetical protein
LAGSAFFAAAFLAAGAFFAVAITISWIKLERAPRCYLQRRDSPPEGPMGLPLVTWHFGLAVNGVASLPAQPAKAQRAQPAEG